MTKGKNEVTRWLAGAYEERDGAMDLLEATTAKLARALEDCNVAVASYHRAVAKVARYREMLGEVGDGDKP